MKKIIILFLSMFLLTGCSAHYNLVLENDSLSESLNVVSNKNDIYDGQAFSNLVENYYNQVDLLVDYTIQLGDMSLEEAYTKYDFYKKSIIDNNGVYGLKLDHVYNDKMNYNKTAIGNSLFDRIVISDNYIKAYGIKDIFANYSNLDDIKISFKTDKKVLSTNCDEETNGVYYWYINRYSNVGRTVKIEFEKNVNIDNEIVRKSKKYWNIIYIVIGLLCVGILIFIVVIYEKIKKSNK